jgi:hypothetical protein
MPDYYVERLTTYKWLRSFSTTMTKAQQRPPELRRSSAEFGCCQAQGPLTKQSGDGLKVHSFQTLTDALAATAKNRIQPTDNNSAV